MLPDSEAEMLQFDPSNHPECLSIPRATGPRDYRSLGDSEMRVVRTLHVGDLYSADIEGGCAAGVHTALVDPYDDWDGVDCPRFKDLEELSRAC